MKKQWFKSERKILFIHEPLSWEGWAVSLILLASAYGWIKSSIFNVDITLKSGFVTVSGLIFLLVIYIGLIRVTKKKENPNKNVGQES